MIICGQSGRRTRTTHEVRALEDAITVRQLITKVGHRDQLISYKKCRQRRPRKRWNRVSQKRAQSCIHAAAQRTNANGVSPWNNSLHGVVGNCHPETAIPDGGLTHSQFQFRQSCAAFLAENLQTACQIPTHTTAAKCAAAMYRTARTGARPPQTMRLPRMVPLSRFMGATPTRAAI